MLDWLKNLCPNVVAYWDRFMESCRATFTMFWIAGLIAFALGLLCGVLLTIWKKDGLRPRRIPYLFLNACISFFRAVPFLILLIFLIPLTRSLVGTAIGVTGAIPPLVFGTVPFFTRQVESVLAEVNPGKVEAARSMGVGHWGIVFRVYLAEAVPGLIRATVITAISLIGLTTMAGAVGAGGIGSFAVNYGQGLHYQDIVVVCVILLAAVVFLLQGLGNALARRCTGRHLFR